MATAPTRMLARAALWAFLALAAAWPIESAAQFIRRSSANNNGKEEDAENVFLPPERTVLQQLARAKQLWTDGEYAEAAQLLDRILDEDEDSFYQPEKNTLSHRSLKAEAQRLIGAMPPRGLETYRLKFGAAAKMHLNEALASGDVEGLALVSRRYFHTDAGYEATFLLGLDHLNRTRPLAAALTLQRLQEAGRGTERFEPMLSLSAAVAWVQAGMPDKAQDLLVKLKDRTHSQTIVLGGKQVPLFTEKVKALDWLAQVVGSLEASDQGEPDRWVMMLGNAARNARVEGSQPLLNMLWQVPGADDPSIDAMLRQMRQMYLEQDQPTLPGLHPLAVNDVVLMRSARTLLGIDFETGKRLWEADGDALVENAIGRLSPELMARQPNIGIGLGQRMWDDTTYGMLSSDGKLVFSIEDLGLGPTVPQQNRTIIVGGRQMANAPQGPSNRLAARDIRNGKLKWHLGGPNDQFALRQAETFFLGPPLPLMGQLYVLAETKNESAVVLMALDAQTGNLLWQQRLAVVEETLQESPGRRMAGVTPSYCDGLLICPTGVGAVVAVDLATRSLLWGYRYRRDFDPNQQMMMLRMNGFYQPGQPTPLRWTDGTAVIADRKVLITPVESDHLHCLDLVNGTKLWQYKRQDDLYLACVHRDLAVLVGRRGVRAIKLKDGLAAWENSTATFPEGAMPSGRGFMSDNKYYVPLTSAEVMSVDLTTGKVVETAKSRRGTVPGNLVCYRGRVISQGMDGVETFYQRTAAEAEVQRRLAKDASDPVALALQGEVLMDQNKLAEAIDAFRRAFEKDNDPRTKGLLRDALLEGLKTQFAAYRPRVDEIQTLLDDPPQKATYLRVMAEGLQAAGEPLPAFEHYMKLMELDGVGRQLETLSRSHSVRRDRWVQARLLGLLEETKDPAVRAKLDATIQARLDATLQSGKISDLQNFLNYLGSHQLAGAARRELAKRLVEADRVLEAEMVLWRDQQSSDPAIAGPAVAQIAEMLRKIGRPVDAAACYARLKGEYAEVVCLDGKTGRELAATIDAESPVRSALEAKDAWPIGAVEVAKLPNKRSLQPAYGRFSLRYDGSPAPFFKDVAVQFDQNQRSVIARDTLGKEMWRVTLGDSQNNVYFNRGTTEGAVHGHLLMMALGNKIIAIDAAGNSTSKPGKLLWDHDLNASFDVAAARNLPVQMWGVMPAWAFQNFQYSRATNRMNGIGPATSQVLCFQRFRNLVAVDPLSGDPLWTHGNVPTNAELFGDDDYVFALPADKTEASVYRALDGKPLGTRKIPRSEPGNGEYYHDARGQRKYVPITVSCMASFGRNMVLWRREGSARVLEYYDPWTEKTLWGPMKFSERAQIDVADNEAVTICEADNKEAHIVIVTLPDGKTVVDTKLKTAEDFNTPQNVTLMQSDGRYLVISSNPRAAQTRARNIQPLPGMMMQPIQQGWVFGFNADGTPAWEKPAPISNQYLAPDQPAGSPLLIFACQEYTQTGNTAQNHILVTCVDKRTGRKVHDEKFPGSINSFEIAVDPSEKTVELRFQQNAIALKLTDKPLPPDDAKVEPKPKTTPVRAILKAFQKSATEIVPPGAEDVADPFG